MDNELGDPSLPSSRSQSTPPSSDSTHGSNESSKTEISLRNSPLKEPPGVHSPYNPQNACEDLRPISYALDLFLDSHMLESEEYCHGKDPEKSRLYFAAGYGLIQCVKALMSFADEDLLAAIGHTRRSIQISQQHRKPAPSITSRIAGFVTRSSSHLDFIKNMTMVERHAELVYADSLFEKALLGIVYSGDWLAFIKEALNMRASISIFQRLGEFVAHADAEATARGEGPDDKLIDAHFRSGVYLGVGLCNLVLSLMPGKLITLVELFGYHGDRHEGLRLLYRVGGWSADSQDPSISIEEEGIRRPICDMALLIFHLVLSSFTFDGIDITMAQRILDWNLKRYSNGVFFMFGAGRLAMIRSQPRRAIEYYTKATEIQSQYRNLHHISFWEIAIANFALYDTHASLESWRQLEAEATWSKAIYSYGMAICLWELGNLDEASKVMAKVPALRQKIAGKSIPLEKFAARKARKFHDQGNRLALPVLELAYVFLAIAHAPREIMSSKMIPAIETVLVKLMALESDQSRHESWRGYWDDYCLTKFLEGVCWRYMAHPDPDAVPDQEEVAHTTREDAEGRAMAAFEFVLANGPKIELDHHLVYYSHYELGRLLACMGDNDGGRRHFDLILSGKVLEVGPSGKKGKYSLENALHLRTHAAVDALQKGVRRL